MTNLFTDEKKMEQITTGLKQVLRNYIKDATSKSTLNYDKAIIHQLINVMYASADDSAHGADHIEEVIKRALEMNKVLRLNIDENLIRVAGLFHDIGNVVNRATHEKIGAEVVRDILTPIGVQSDIVKKISDAVAFHRASFKGTFGNNKLAELISSADRGEPDSVYVLLDRSRKYAIKEQHKSPDSATRHAVEHIREKYGRNGYGKFPGIYLDFYGKQVMKLWDDIDNMTVEKYGAYLKGGLNG